MKTVSRRHVFMILILLIPSILSFIPIPVVNASTTDIYQVSLGTDDGGYRASGGGFFASGSTVEALGDVNDVFFDYEIGLRFQGIVLPNGAIIVSAYLNMTAYDKFGVAIPEFTINGEDNDDTVTFSTKANFEARIRTDETVTWTPPAWVQWTWYPTDDISSIVQVLVDRVGWESGNDMTFFCKDSGEGWNGVYRYVRIMTENYLDGERACFLHVTWSVVVPPHITFYNQSNSLFMMNGTKVTNGTVTIYDNDTLLELQGIINKSYTFTYWNWTTDNAEINPYNFTVAGNATIWLMVDSVDGGDGETLFLFGSVNAIPFNLLYYIALTAIGLTLLMKARFLGKILSVLLFAFQAIWISGDVLLDTQINYISAYNETTGIYQYANTVTHIGTPILSFLIILSIGLALKGAIDVFRLREKRKG